MLNMGSSLGAVADLASTQLGGPASSKGPGALWKPVLYALPVGTLGGGAEFAEPPAGSGSHLFPARSNSNPSFTLANGSVCVISKSELNFFSK